MIVFFHLNFRPWRLGAIRYQLRYTPIQNITAAKNSKIFGLSHYPVPFAAKRKFIKQL